LNNENEVVSSDGKAINCEIVKNVAFDRGRNTNFLLLNLLVQFIIFAGERENW
jgi:hypothetical protein